MDKNEYLKAYLMIKRSSDNREQMKKQLRDVILIHGWRSSPKAMDKIRKALEREGRNVYAVDYSKDKERARAIVMNKVIPYLRAHPNADVVTHSTGGLLARMAGQPRYGDLLKNRRVVMVAPPAKGSYLANINDIVVKSGHGGFMDQPILKDLEVGSDTIKNLKPIKGGDIGVVAGSHNADYLKKIRLYLKFLKYDKIGGQYAAQRDALWHKLNTGVGDGVVKLENTKLPSEKARVVLPYNHAGLIKEKDSVNKIVNFLDTGQFS